MVGIDTLAKPRAVVLRGLPWQRVAMAEGCHSRGLSWKRVVMAEGCHGRGLSWQRVAMAEGCHGRGWPWQRVVTAEGGYGRGWPALMEWNALYTICILAPGTWHTLSVTIPLLSIKDLAVVTFHQSGAG